MEHAEDGAGREIALHGDEPALRPGLIICKTIAARRAGAMRQLSMLVGAVVIARAVGHDKLGDKVLAACRCAPPGPAQRKR